MGCWGGGGSEGGPIGENVGPVGDDSCLSRRVGAMGRDAEGRGAPGSGGMEWGG